jgi:DNA-binding PadR family transcriptional regulator
MSVKHAILGILAQSPRHGYELKTEFEERLGDLWKLNIGQIYSTLERLQAEELVEPEGETPSAKTEKRVYRITEAGIAEFEAWRNRPLKLEPRSLRDELFVKLAFMEDEDAESVFILFQSQHSIYMSQLMHLTNRKVQIEQEAKFGLQKAKDSQERKAIERQRTLKLMLLDVAIFHTEADLRWLQHSEKRLKELFGK